MKYSSCVFRHRRTNFYQYIRNGYAINTIKNHKKDKSSVTVLRLYDQMLAVSVVNTKLYIYPNFILGFQYPGNFSKPHRFSMLKRSFPGVIRNAEICSVIF